MSRAQLESREKHHEGQTYDLEKSDLGSLRIRHLCNHPAYQKPRLLTKPPLKLSKKLWANLITTISLHPPQHPLPLIMRKQGFAGLLELPQSSLPSLLPIIFPLRQRFPRHVIPPLHPRFVKTGVINPPARRMHPSIRYSTQNDVDRGE